MSTKLIFRPKIAYETLNSISMDTKPIFYFKVGTNIFILKNWYIYYYQKVFHHF